MGTKWPGTQWEIYGFLYSDGIAKVFGGRVIENH